MFENLTTLEILKLFAPIIIADLGLKIFCVIKIVREGVRNLSKFIWILIVIFINIFGPVSFLLFGRRR
ncbi:PLDc N-terminal domain-containing protein [Caloranaerobacter ferrireducens]|uniref:PLDc N-terminal domain-containing protein n=1 Tax=Caloranaerobacter ferrireducens TaxID=1323370 RepID=UPI00084DB8BD|nr:PLD nuclease N-terminal domain-containing protein [Caloranaerobacter ferrireducens]